MNFGFEMMLKALINFKNFEKFTINAVRGISSLTF